MNEEILEIDGKKYVFCANRKAFTILGKLGDFKDNTTKSIEMLDEVWLALLRKHQPEMNINNVNNLLDKAVEEGYAYSDLMTFSYELISEAFTQASNKEKKIIPFLEARKEKEKEV